MEPLTVPVEVDFQELFAYSLTNEDEYLVQDEQINLEQIIRDAVVLNLPFHPLCSTDCLGLCPDCGVKMADNPHHVHEVSPCQYQRDAYLVRVHTHVVHSGRPLK
ncbi:MAG: hypothetical protein RL723_1152 [Actinomycetota bacterium]